MVQHETILIQFFHSAPCSFHFSTDVGVFVSCLTVKFFEEMKEISVQLLVSTLQQFTRRRNAIQGKKEETEATIHCLDKEASKMRPKATKPLQKYILGRG